MYIVDNINPFGPKCGISRTFAHQDEERFFPLSAGNGELILLTYLRGPKGLSIVFYL